MAAKKEPNFAEAHTRITYVLVDLRNVKYHLESATKAAPELNTKFKIDEMIKDVEKLQEKLMKVKSYTHGVR